jgi:hypothetical protein
MKMLSKIIGSSIAIAAALTFSASTTQAQNLLVNPGFDASGAGNFTANPITIAGINQGWATFGNVGQNDMSSSPDSPISTPYALLEVNGVGSSWSPQGAYQITDGIAEGGAIIPGDTYTYSIWAITDTGTTWGPTPVDLQLSFNDVTGIGGTVTPIGLSPNNGSFNYGTSVANTANGWVEYSVSAVAPAGAAYAMVYAMFMDYGQVTPENMYFDSASLLDVTPIPEPSTLALLSLGLAVPFYFIRRRKS